MRSAPAGPAPTGRPHADTTLRRLFRRRFINAVASVEIVNVSVKAT